MRQEDDECSLAKESGFTAHIRTSDDHNLRLFFVQVYIVRHVALPEGKLLLDDGVATGAYVDGESVIHDRADVALGDGYFGEARETV